MKNTDIADRGLKIFIYDMLKGAFYKEHHLNLMKLGELGFLVGKDYCMSDDLAEINQFYQKISQKREDFPFQIDGIVCRVNNSKAREILGSDSKSPKWAVAWKFPSEQAQSQLRYIENSVGRSGVITPVAWLQPVDLLGTKVQKASLYNYQQIKKLNIYEQDTLIIEKGGDIIPKVIAVNLEKRISNKNIAIPTRCPECNSLLQQSNTEIDLYCNNSSCPSIVLGNLIHFASKKGMDIETLGSANIKRFYQKGWLQKITDFYYLREKSEQIINLEGFGEISLKNLVKNIEQSKQKPLDKVIYALGIPHIGENYAKQIAAVSGNIDGFIGLQKKVLEKLDNFGDIVIQAVSKWLVKNKELLLELKACGLGKEFYQGKIAQLGSVVITGTLSISREKWQEILEEKGFKLASVVNKKTVFLVAESLGKSSSKLEKAKKLGVEVISEKELEEKLQEL